MSHKQRIPQLTLVLSHEWYHKREGMSFGEASYADPIARTELMMDCARMAHRHFADVALGSAEVQPAPIASHSYGDRFMSALFGCEIQYFDDQAPCVKAMNADVDHLLGLDTPNIVRTDAVKKMLSDAKQLRGKYGFASGAINFGSPINVAVSVYGEDFLAACALKPEAAQHVLKVIGEATYRLDSDVSSAVDPEHFPQAPASIGYGNCPAILFSPAMYRSVLLPVDHWFRNQVRDFHLHHCGVFDRYIDIYKELNPSTIDVGGGSDYRALRAVFPDTPISLLVNAPDVEHLNEAEIDDFVADVVERAGPPELITRIACVELSASVPDDTVRALATVHLRI